MPLMTLLELGEQAWWPLDLLIDPDDLEAMNSFRYGLVSLLVDPVDPEGPELVEALLSDKAETTFKLERERSKDQTLPGLI
jgi:hypothetical protein